MPELPEVETTVRGLNTTVKGKVIVDMWYDHAGMFRGITPEKLKSQTIGFKVLHAERRAKNILVYLSNDHVLVIHMKMTGHLLYGKWKIEDKRWVPVTRNTELGDPFNRFIHVLWTFNDGSQLALCDMRKFAKVEYIDITELHEHHRLGNLGPEPLIASPKQFVEALLNKPKAKIKTVLMDQSILSGIGNIYSDEILWATKVHPASLVGAIPHQLLRSMSAAAKHILKKSLKVGGDSKSDYRDIHGKKGEFQHLHKAYRRTGEKCTKEGCRGRIERLVIGGRSAHFCNNHQKYYT